MPNCGPIEPIAIEDITGAPDGLDVTGVIRILTGVKCFPNGTKLYCPIADITLRRITEIREFKPYDRTPNACP